MLYIFDFDGTIADTHASIVMTTQLTLRLMQRPERPEEEITACIGLPLKEMFLRFDMNDEEADRACDIYRREFDDTAAGRVSLFPTVKETLHTLHNGGHTLAIASSRNTASLFLLLEEFSLRLLFSHVLGANSVEQHKPHPEAVLRILAATETKTEEAIVIGDATFDILMGNAAGCRTVAVTYGNQPRQLLETAAPHFIIDKMADLLKLFK